MQFVGWGGLKRQLVDAENDLIADGTFTKDEYHRAFVSVINAHFTSQPIIRALWTAVQNLGFSRGRVLEPSMGIGHFAGLMPADVQATTFAGVELDTVSGLIASQLYPRARVQVTGFQDAQRPNSYFDLAISNIPFGNVRVSDPASKIPTNVRASLHNYFFAKANQKVRPGGLVVFIGYSVHEHTIDGVAPPYVYQTKEQAAARLLQILGIKHPVFPQNWPERVEIGAVQLEHPDGE